MDNIRSHGIIVFRRTHLSLSNQETARPLWYSLLARGCREDKVVDLSPVDLDCITRLCLLCQYEEIATAKGFLTVSNIGSVIWPSPSYRMVIFDHIGKNNHHIDGIIVLQSRFSLSTTDDMMCIWLREIIMPKILSLSDIHQYRWWKEVSPS